MAVALLCSQADLEADLQGTVLWRAEFERHLGCCRQCSDYLHTYRETVKLGKAAFQHDLSAPVPASVPEELINTVLVLTSRSPQL